MMLVSSSGWAHSPITLIFTALSAVYGAAPALAAAPSSTASADNRSTPSRLTSLSLTLAPLRTTSNTKPIPAFRGVSSPVGGTLHQRAYRCRTDVRRAHASSERPRRADARRRPREQLRPLRRGPHGRGNADRRHHAARRPGGRAR